MAYDYNTQSRQTAASSALDLGLQAYMRGVFNTMAGGLGLTGFVAYAVANVPALFNLVFHTGLAWIAIFAPLVFMMAAFRPSAIASKSAASLRSSARPPSRPPSASPRCSPRRASRTRC